ncbi:MAG: hypothetical protein M0023_02965 [Desulfobacteraceae bacterium]|nr:hypothetical protein [Desulfobacteraceae bacterium]
MNSKSVKITSLAVMFMSVLLLLGIAGAVNPAFAANEIIINGGAPVTNYRQVTLTLTPTPPTGSVSMSFRNESGIWSADESIAVTKQWTLSTPDGNKKVSVRFKNASGATLVSFFSTITLDYIIDTSFSNPLGFAAIDNIGLQKISGRAVAVQPGDQKIVVVGTIDNGLGKSVLGVFRYNPDGTLDTSFGPPTGSVHYGDPTGTNTGNAVAIQPDGKIVVVGTVDMGSGRTGLWLLRLTTTGALDPTFNPGYGGGYLEMGGFGLNSTGNGVAIQPDGKIVAVGTYARPGVNKTTPWVLRFDTNGTLDPTFNSGAGQVTVNAVDGQHTGNGLALDSSGNIFVAGTYDQGGGVTSVWALKFNSSGHLDTTFGGRGTGENTFGSYGAHSGRAVAIQPGGKIDIVGVYDWTGGDTDLWLLQLKSDGTLDDTFNPSGSGTPGTVALGGTGADSGNAVTIDASGRIVVAGAYDTGSGNTLLLAQRFTGAGAYDTTFNQGNSSYQFAQSGKFSGQGVALQADGKIVLTGTGNDLAGAASILALRLHDHTVPLTINISGSGSVEALPGDITWAGSTGSGNYIQDTTVVLTATPAGGATFSGWSGCDSTSGSLNEVCTVTMNSSKTVSASFTPQFPLTVTVNGIGLVTSSPGSIACGTGGSNCSDSFLNTTTVTLTAQPAWYSLFGSWSGGPCNGSTALTCDVPMTQATSVTANFISSSNAKVVETGNSYAKLQDAYLAANAYGATATTQAKDSGQIIFQEDLNFYLPVSVMLDGGRGTNFAVTSPGAYTLVRGSLTISNGQLSTRYLKIMPTLP